MDYTSYSTIKADLKSQLSLLTNWSTTLFYGVYDAIISMVAYAINKDAYLGYYLYKESGWATAESTASLRGMSFLLGYTPHRKIGASGNAEVSGSSVFSSTYEWQGSNVFIPRWTRFSDRSKSVNCYCTKFTTYYTNQVGNCEVPIKEGTPKQYTYIAKGEVSEKVYLYSTSIDNTELDVFIVDSNGNIITQIDIVYNLHFKNEPSVYYCSVEDSPNLDYICFTFGDNVSAKQLDAGTYVLFKYAETNGSTGNISSTGTISKILDTLYDANGNVVTGLYTTNTSIISGGQDYEDIESIRNNAPNLFVAGYRCGTLADWNHIVDSFYFVAKSNVWSINSVGGSSLISEQNTMYITAIASDGNELSTVQKNELINTIQDNYASPTEIVQFDSPQKVYIYFEVNATIKNSTSSVMANTIKTTLQEAYTSINSDFAIKLYQSDYIELVSNIPNIVYHDTEAKMMDYNIGYAVSEYVFKGYYNSTVLTDKVLVEYNSPEIWIKRKIEGVWQTPQKIGVASGTNFIPAPGSTYTFANTSISYTSYTYSFIINEILVDYTNNNKATYGINDPTEADDLGYIICMVYTTQDGNGGQTNSIRLGSPFKITDVDPYFVFPTITES